MIRTDIRPITVREYRDMPEGPPYFQLIEGDIHMSPSPNFFHQTILTNLVVLIRAYLKTHPIGKVQVAPSDVELNDTNVYQPDLYFIRNERLDILTEQGPVGAPDLVVEILSPRTAQLDVGAKRLVYARSGVKEMWVLHPDEEKVEIFRFDQDADRPSATLRGDDSLESALLPGFSVPLAKVFER
jgi:Uma2 family endonuclease